MLLNTMHKNTFYWYFMIVALFVSESLNSIFLLGSIYYPGIFLTYLLFSGWSRRHHIVRSQLWRWGKTLCCLGDSFHVGDLGVSVIYPLCSTPVAGDCEQSTAAEAVGLEASSVYAHLEGHSHCARGQHDLWLHLHPPGHRLAASGFVASVYKFLPDLSCLPECFCARWTAGGCDGTIKIWDVVKQYCTHNLKGSSGVVQ